MKPGWGGKAEIDLLGFGLGDDIERVAERGSIVRGEEHAAVSLAMHSSDARSSCATSKAITWAVKIGVRSIHPLGSLDGEFLRLRVEKR